MGTGAYFKKNGAWVQASKVYQKVNGIWMERDKNSVSTIPVFEFPFTDVSEISTIRNNKTIMNLSNS